MVVGSYAPQRVEIALISGGTVVNISAEQFFRSAQIELVAGGSWTGTVELFDRQGDFLENIVIVAGTSRALRFTFGRGPEFPGENMTLNGNITTYRPLFEPNGVTLTLEAVASGVVDAMTSISIRSFPDGQKISDIVRQIAVFRGWTTSDALGRSTIEDTRDVLKQPFTSNGESDVAFIQQYLRPQAVNESGVGDYRFFFDESNAAHFHTPEFLPPVEHPFVYARNIAGDVISFAPADVSLFGVLMGGGNTIFGGLSSLNGASARARSTVTGGVENAGFPVVSDSGSRVDYGSGVHSYIDLATRDPEELRRLSQSRFDEFRKYGYKAEMTVYGTHRVRVLDYAAVRYIKATPAEGTSPEHYLSGRFQVFKISHSVQLAEWETTFQMLRGGVEVAGAQPVQATQTIVPAVASDDSGGSFGVEVDT